MSARHKTCKWTLRNIKIIKLYKYNAYHNHSQRTTLNLGLPRRHLGEFKCNKCKKLFGQKASLLVHKRRHSKIKPYKCGKCNKGFITRAGLFIHKKSHNIRKVRTHQKNIVNDSSRPVRKRMAEADQNTPKHRWVKKQTAKTTIKKEPAANISGDDGSNADADNFSEETSPIKDLSQPKEPTRRMITRMQGKRKVPPNVKKRGRKPKLMKSKTKPIANSSTENNASNDQNDSTDQHIKKENVIKDEIINKDDTKKAQIKNKDETQSKDEVKVKRIKKVASEDGSKTSGDSAKKTRVYQCDFCSKMCYDSSQLRSHRRLHTGEKPFVCKVCNKGFRMNACLNVHMRVHTGEMPFHCSTCSKDFRYLNTFNKHLATHQPDVEKQVQCKVCGKQFLTRESLWDHKQKLRKCDICSELFCTFAALNIHKHKTHVDTFSVSKADGKFCQFCTKKFNSNYTYFVHMQKHARKGMPIKFPCPVCSESFGSYDDLRIHRKTHTIPREKCVTCPWSHCGKKLTSQVRLDSHLKRHNGETQYLCSRCGMSFTDCVYYLKHRRACYQKVTKYACSWCGKILSGHSALQKHILSHKGEKPCQCEVCGARFNNSSHLKRHKRIHIRKGEMPPFEESTAKASQTVESILCYPDVIQGQDYAEYTVEIGNEQVVAYFINKETEQVELKAELICATENVAKTME